MGKYQDSAKKIIQLVGGKENVKNLIHCQTRLRFDLADPKKADTEALKAIPEVAGVIDSGGQFQVVIGTHVEEVYNDIIPLIGEGSNTGEAPETKKNFLSRAVEFISTAFSPIIPAMAGAGMIKAFLALLVVFQLVSNESQTYYIVSFMADSVFYFLPFFLANTAAKKLKCNPFLAMALAGILLHPNFVKLVAAGDPVALFAMPVRLVGYNASVIPILLIVIVQSYIEKFFSRVIPNAVKIVFVPMLTILLTGIVALVAVGPLGSYAGELIAAGFNAIRATAPWAPAVIVGTFLPIMVMFGIHTSIGPLDVLQLTSVGYANIFGPGAMVSNIATGVATLVAGSRTKNSKEKQIATSAGITALMGVTEPALYGVTLPKRYPLIASMIGGGLGGLYAGLSGVARFATGSSGLPAIPLYIGEDLSNVMHICIAILIATVSTALLTYFLSFRFEKAPETRETGESICALYSPVTGEMHPLADAQDEAFASQLLGKGVLFQPSEGAIAAPFDGKVVSVSATQHAIGLVSDDGTEVLIHVGLDTVKLGGKYFTPMVKQGERVKTGQLLLQFDLEKLKEEGYQTETPMVITNSDRYKILSPSSFGVVRTGDQVLTLETNEEAEI